MSHPHHTHIDPRDHLIPAEEVNATPHYVMYSVFRTVGPLRDPDTATAEKAVLDTGVSIRGWYDIGGFRADADLMLWTLANDPHQLQTEDHHPVQVLTVNSSPSEAGVSAPTSGGGLFVAL